MVRSSGEQLLSVYDHVLSHLCDTLQCLPLCQSLGQGSNLQAINSQAESVMKGCLKAGHQAGVHLQSPPESH